MKFIGLALLLLTAVAYARDRTCYALTLQAHYQDIFRAALSWARSKAQPSVIRVVNIQVTILKVLVSYPNGMASLEDIKRDMAILARSGVDWADYTRRLAAKVPSLSVFTMHLVERYTFGWRITDKGRAVLNHMEGRGATVEPPVIEASFEGVEAVLRERFGGDAEGAAASTHERAAALARSARS